MCCVSGFKGWDWGLMYWGIGCSVDRVMDNWVCVWLVVWLFGIVVVEFEVIICVVLCMMWYIFLVEFGSMRSFILWDWWLVGLFFICSLEWFGRGCCVNIRLMIRVMGCFDRFVWFCVVGIFLFSVLEVVYCWVKKEMFIVECIFMIFVWYGVLEVVVV